MILDHPSLEPFEPIMRELFDTAFGNALQGLAISGLRPGDELHTDALFIFQAACLPGFKQAQDKLGAIVIELENLICSVTREEAKKRENREIPDAEHCRKLRKVLHNRQLVLRRLIDGMLWTLFLPNKWMLRRLRVEGGIRRVNSAEIPKLLEAVAHQHAKGDDDIWISCDLSTIAQIGDVILAKWMPGRNRMMILVVEMKIGPKNEIIYNRLREVEISGLEDEISNISTELGPKAGKQAARMARQMRRLTNFKHVLATDEGIHPLSGQRYQMTKKSHMSKDYLDQIHDIIARAKVNGLSSVTIESCLHLLAVAVVNEPDQTDEGLRVAHQFFHMRSGKFCKLSSTETAKQEELDAITKGPKVINLLDFNMFTSIAMPPLLWYPRDSMLDVLMGRVKIFSQFDHERFFDLASRVGLKMSFIRGKEAARIKSAKLSGPLPEYRDLRYVRAENVRGKSMFFGARFFTKIYTEHVRPSDLLEMTRDLIDEAEQNDASKL